MVSRLAAALFAVCLALTAPPAAAQGGLPNHDESVALLNIVALKGGECGLLRPWEAATVQALADQGSFGWERPRLEAMLDQMQTHLAQTSCDEPFLNVWIDGARRGLETEYLSLHLVVYRTLRSMPTLPNSLRDSVQRTTPSADIAAIDEKLAALEASGARPDGGGPWPDFIARTSTVVERYAPLLDRGEAPAEIAFMIPRAIAISELWLADQATDAPGTEAGVCRPGTQFDQATFAAELAAGETFTLPVHERLTLRLAPTRFGWRIEALDRGGVDRALITPPLRLPETNPRNIAGWHFRNAENTGPNLGDVNAPQHRREFVFGPEPVAQDPSGAPPTRPTVEPQTAEYGRGVLVIEDFRLADLEPGQRARFAYLKVAGCIAWIRGPERDPEPVSEYSGVYRQGFEQSDFYTDDGDGPWWLEAEGKDWDRLMSFRVPRPGRGSFVTVRLTVRGSTAPFDGQGVTASGNDTRIVVEDILAIEPISDEAFHAAVRGRSPD